MKKKILNKQLIFEQLEPRLLLSADLVPVPFDGGLPVDNLTMDSSDFESELFSLLNATYDSGISGTEPLRHEVLFIDSNVSDYQQLIDDLLAKDDRQVDVILLNSNSNGIEQITETLNNYQDLDAVHIFSHASDGSVQLGNSWLSLENTDNYTGSISSWQNALTDDADLLFYGCNLAQTDSGQSLINTLSTLTGADVAASDDFTGQAVLGGDWELEYDIGQIETEVIFSSEVQQSWTGILDSITVTTTLDVLDGDADTSSLAALSAARGSDGLISLREAIIAANTDTSQADTITLDAGTYTLSLPGTSEDLSATGDLDIRDDLTITGAGADVTIIDAAGIDRAFDILSNAGIINISGVTITNGDAGNDGGGGLKLLDGNTLSISDSQISNNTTAGLGGGLYNISSTLNLTNVTVSENSADEGAGILVSNSAGGTLINTTISGNTSANNGGGIHTASDLTIINSTIAYNSSTTGTGGIFAQGSGDADLLNTILSNNTGGNANTSLSSSGYNIDSDGTAGIANTGDQSGTVGTPIDVKLGGLQNNGGINDTHALLAGSPAINAGTATGASVTDQRGELA